MAVRDMKIVNLEQLNINRECTISIFVEKDGVVTTSEMMEAIDQRGWIQVTKMLQQTSRNRFRWSVVSYTDATNILQQVNEENLAVGIYSTTCTYAARYKTYILYDTPYEVTPAAVRMILEPYGKIETLRRTVYRDYPNIFDGRVIVSFSEVYSDRLPDIFQLKGGQIIVREAGQPVRRVECTKCRIIGAHSTRDCINETTCDRCGTQGHRRYQCPETRADKEERIRRENERKQAVKQRNQEIDLSKDLDLSPDFMKEREQDETNSTRKQNRAVELLETLAAAGGIDEIKEKLVAEDFEAGQNFDNSEDPSQEARLIIDERQDRNDEEGSKQESDKLTDNQDSVNITESTEPEVLIDKTFDDLVKRGVPSQTVTSTPIHQATTQDEKVRLWSERSSEIENITDSPKKVKMVTYVDKQQPQQSIESSHTTSIVQSVVQELEKARMEKGKIPVSVHVPKEQRERSRDRQRDKKKDKKAKDRRSESRHGREQKR